MRQRKLIALIVAVFAICMVANVAMADNRVEVKVTSEPIPFGAQCSKAGGFSFEWDPNSVIRVGDKIFIDLPTVVVGGGVEKVTTCKQDIDFVVAPVQAADGEGNAQEVIFNTDTGFWEFATGWGDGEAGSGSVLPADLQSQTGPFGYVNGQAPNTPDSTGRIIFWVHAKKGDSRVTVEVVGHLDDTDSQIVVASDSTAGFILSIFDLKAGDAYVVDGIYKDADGKANADDLLVYSEPVDSDDNALCIDVFVTDTQTVGGLSTFNASLKSQGTDADDNIVDPKFTFIPSNPQIAHIGGDLDFKLADCKAVNVDVPKGQEGEVVCSFDPANGSQLIINGDFQINDKYDIKLTLTSPSNAYWGKGAQLTTYNRNKTSLPCGKAPGTAYESGKFEDSQVFDATGEEIDPDDLADGTGCTVADDQKGVILTGEGITFPAGTYTGGIYLPSLPMIVFNGVPQEGDKIEIEVVLTKQPCGEISLGTLTLAVYGSAGSTLLYPYYTPMADTDSWWDGFVVDNLGDKEGKAIAYAYEADGDQGMIEFTVKGNSQFVTLLSAILGDMTVTEAGGSGVLGDSSLYIKVKTEFDADGFAMMGNGMEAQGYLPRD